MRIAEPRQWHRSDPRRADTSTGDHRADLQRPRMRGRLHPLRSSSHQPGLSPDPGRRRQSRPAYPGPAMAVCRLAECHRRNQLQQPRLHRDGEPRDLARRQLGRRPAQLRYRRDAPVAAQPAARRLLRRPHRNRHAVLGQCRGLLRPADRRAQRHSGGDRARRLCPPSHPQRRQALSRGADGQRLLHVCPSRLHRRDRRLRRRGLSARLRRRERLLPACRRDRLDPRRRRCDFDPPCPLRELRR
jgi:hypothetical protein